MEIIFELRVWLMLPSIGLVRTVISLLLVSVA